MVRLATTHREVLAPEENAREASWSTFTNSTAGVWVGSTAAFHPETGEAEELYPRQQEAFTITMDTVSPVRMSEGEGEPTGEGVVRSVMRELNLPKGAAEDDEPEVRCVYVRKLAPKLLTARKTVSSCALTGA